MNHGHLSIDTSVERGRSAAASTISISNIQAEPEERNISGILVLSLLHRSRLIIQTTVIAFEKYTFYYNEFQANNWHKKCIDVS